MPAAEQAEQAILRELGTRIRVARKAANLTQEEAAHLAGMDWRRWQRIERGSANLTIRTLIRITGALRTSFWELLVPPPKPETPPSGNVLPPSRGRFTEDAGASPSSLSG